MPRYKVHTDSHEPEGVIIKADYAEVEGDGVLVFYDEPDPDNPSISTMADDDTIVRAFREWRSLTQL